MSTVNSIHHIIINTYRREMTIPEQSREELYRYIWGIVRNHQFVLYRIGGIENHIHLLINLHPGVALSSLMRDIKQFSSKWAKGNPLFPKFSGWGKEYAAFSCSYSSKDAIIEYIKNQREHHHGISFEQEFKSLLGAEELPWDDNKLT